MHEPERMPLSLLPTAEWWLIAASAWVQPGQWLGRCALPMRGPLASGGDPVAPETLPPAARTLETDDMLLPGLHDSHVHSALVDLRAVRRGGISAVTDLGGVPGQLERLRRECRVLGTDLPAVQIVGAFLTAPGGYPTDRVWAPKGCWREIYSAVDAETAVAEQQAVGAELIKVAINVDAGPVLAAPVLAALVAAAHTRSLPVVAHAEGEGAVRMALAAGVDVLAHVPWTETLSPDLVLESARQTTWISTLQIHNPRSGGTSWDTVGINLLEFLGAGGTVRYGTDLGNGPQPLGVNTAEILALETLSLSVDELLAALTGPLTGPSGEGAGSPSRFLAGVAPCLLTNGISRHQVVVGSALRQAQVFSLDLMHDIEKVWGY